MLTCAAQKCVEVRFFGTADDLCVRKQGSMIVNEFFWATNTNAHR